MKNLYFLEVIFDEIGQLLIIVIEDWVLGVVFGELESVEMDVQLLMNRKVLMKRMSWIFIFILDDVIEESEEEVQKYEYELMLF